MRRQQKWKDSTLILLLVAGAAALVLDLLTSGAALVGASCAAIVALGVMSGRRDLLLKTASIGTLVLIAGGAAEAFGAGGNLLLLERAALAALLWLIALAGLARAGSPQMSGNEESAAGALLPASPDEVFLFLDSAGNVEAAVGATRSVLGLDEAQVLTRPASDILGAAYAPPWPASGLQPREMALPQSNGDAAKPILICGATENDNSRSVLLVRDLSPLREAEAERDAARSECSRLLQENARLREQMTELELGLNELRAEAYRLRNLVEELEYEKKALEYHVRQLEVDILRKDQEIMHLGSQIAVFSAQLEQAKKELTAAIDELSQRDEATHQALRRLEGHPAAAIVVNHGRVRWANENACLLTGLDQQHFVGSELHRFLPELDDAAIGRKLSDHGPRMLAENTPTPLRRGDGCQLQVLVEMTPADLLPFDPDDKQRDEVLVILRDATPDEVREQFSPWFSLPWWREHPDSGEVGWQPGRAAILSHSGDSDADSAADEEPHLVEDDDLQTANEEVDSGEEEEFVPAGALADSRLAASSDGRDEVAISSVMTYADSAPHDRADPQVAIQSDGASSPDAFASDIRAKAQSQLLENSLRPPEAQDPDPCADDIEVGTFDTSVDEGGTQLLAAGKSGEQGADDLPPAEEPRLLSADSDRPTLHDGSDDPIAVVSYKAEADDVEDQRHEVDLDDRTEERSPREDDFDW